MSRLALVAALLLGLALLPGCQQLTPAYRITYEDAAAWRGESGWYTAYALQGSPPDGVGGSLLMSIFHGPIEVGHRGWVHTWRGRVAFFVVAVTRESWVTLRTFERLHGGDSGAGVVGDCGRYLGAIVARPQTAAERRAQR